MSQLEAVQNTTHSWVAEDPNISDYLVLPPIS